MSKRADARKRLIGAGTELFRRQGYVGTSVEQVCAQAGVTKGAVFHHFKTKDDLAEACLMHWDGQLATMDERAPYHSVTEPLEKLIACMDFYIGVFSKPGILKSCLAGTTVQEVSESHPRLREAANCSFTSGAGRFVSLLDAAAAARGKTIDSASLAGLWMAAVQGSLILCKASGDEAVIRTSLEHVRDYIKTLLSS